MRLLQGLSTNVGSSSEGCSHRKTKNNQRYQNETKTADRPPAPDPHAAAVGSHTYPVDLAQDRVHGAPAREGGRDPDNSEEGYGYQATAKGGWCFGLGRGR